MQQPNERVDCPANCNPRRPLVTGEEQVGVALRIRNGFPRRAGLVGVVVAAVPVGERRAERRRHYETPSRDRHPPRRPNVGSTSRIRRRRSRSSLARWGREPARGAAARRGGRGGGGGSSSATAGSMMVAMGPKSAGPGRAGESVDSVGAPEEDGKGAPRSRRRRRALGDRNRGRYDAPRLNAIPPPRLERRRRT